jgi:hypothetical protein
MPTEADDFKIEPVNMAQTMSVAANMVAATLNLFIKEDDPEEQKVGISYAAIAVFLHSFCMAAKHKDKMIAVMKIIITELENVDAPTK